VIRVGLDPEMRALLDRETPWRWGVPVDAFAVEGPPHVRAGVAQVFAQILAERYPGTRWLPSDQLLAPSNVVGSSNRHADAGAAETESVVALPDDLDSVFDPLRP
jgi:hypothetical protein